MNLYRIGTGTDDRANSLAGFLKRHSNGIKKTAILVETNKNNLKTYGEVFYDEMIKASPEFVSFEQSGHIKKILFDRSDLKEFDSIFNSIKSDFNAILFLGVGEYYNHIINKYYKGAYPSDSLAKFGGYMFGYALNEELEKPYSDIVNNRVFEITDLNLARSGFDAPAIVNKFRSEFGGFHPGLRDEASYYDIGLCLSQALSILKDSLNVPSSRHIEFNRETLIYFNKILKENRFEAISNNISFDAQGLNSKSILKTAIYDSLTNSWKPIHRDSIMNLK